MGSRSTYCFLINFLSFLLFIAPVNEGRSKIGKFNPLFIDATTILITCLIPHIQLQLAYSEVDAKRRFHEQNPTWKIRQMLLIPEGSGNGFKESGGIYVEEGDYWTEKLSADHWEATRRLSNWVKRLKSPSKTPRDAQHVTSLQLFN